MLLNNTYKILTNVFTGKFVIYAFASIIISLLLVKPLNASTIEQLVDEKEIELSIRLQNESTPVVGQQLIFEIELATKYSFAKPIKYRLPKVKNTANSPRKSPGYNSNKMVNGETWTSQVRELALFSIKEGQYRIPPIEVSVAIQTPTQGAIEGVIMTAPYTFEVILPAELNDIKEFIVSTDVKMEINNDQPDTESYSIGEAITLTVVISATDVPSMLLPASLQQSIEGLSIYRKPPKLSDKTNRGFLTGRRSDSVTYIFEQAGKYQIPQKIIYWWNPELKELNELVIPAKTWLVDGKVISKVTDIGDTRQFESSTEIFKNLLFILLAIVLFVTLFQYRNWLFNGYSKITKRQHRILRKEFVNAIETEQYLVACQKLYQLVDFRSVSATSLKEYYQTDPIKIVALQKLLALAYNDNVVQVFRKSEAKLLIKSVKSVSVRLNVAQAFMDI
jgi:hypothetical protein